MCSVLRLLSPLPATAGQCTNKGRSSSQAHTDWEGYIRKMHEAQIKTKPKLKGGKTLPLPTRSVRGKPAGSPYLVGFLESPEKGKVCETQTGGIQENLGLGSPGLLSSTTTLSCSAPQRCLPWIAPDSQSKTAVEGTDFSCWGLRM